LFPWKGIARRGPELQSGPDLCSMPETGLEPALGINPTRPSTRLECQNTAPSDGLWLETNGLVRRCAISARYVCGKGSVSVGIRQGDEEESQKNAPKSGSSAVFDCGPSNRHYNCVGHLSKARRNIYKGADHDARREAFFRPVRGSEQSAVDCARSGRSVLDGTGSRIGTVGLAPTDCTDRRNGIGACPRTLQTHARSASLVLGR
jgi:hypothetical protein